MLSLDKLCNFVECCMLCDYFEYICRLLDGCMAYCRCNFDKLSVCTKGFYYKFDQNTVTDITYDGKEHSRQEFVTSALECLRLNMLHHWVVKWQAFVLGM